MSKIITVAVAGGAYLLGAKAGRQRYEDIAGQARKLWRDPRVQQKASEATEVVKEQAAKVSGTHGGSSSKTHPDGAKPADGRPGAASQ